MQVNFKGIYRIPYHDMNNMTRESSTRFALDTMTMYNEPLSQRGYRYDGVYENIKPEYDKAFEAACKKHGINFEKVDNKAEKSDKREIYGCSPKGYRFTDIIKSLQYGKVTNVETDKYDRPVVTINNRYKVIQQKSGNKIVKDSAITLFVNKDDQVTRAIAPLQEIIYFKNGSSVDIELKDGKRTGNYTFYSKEYPEGVEVTSYGEDKSGIRYSNLFYNPFETQNVISNERKVAKHDVDGKEMECLKGSQKTYTPELLRALVFGKI